MDDKIFVMNASKNLSGDFVGLKQMVEVGACVIFTTFTVTVWFERGEVVSVFGVFDINSAVFSIERTVARHTSWADAVESIAAIFSANK